MAVKFTTLENVVVTSAGTPIQISTDPIMVNAVFVQAHEDNTGNIYVGDENVSSTRATSIGPGQPLQYAGHPQMQMLSELLISDIWVDAQVSGDKIRVGYFRRKKYDSFS